MGDGKTAVVRGTSSSQTRGVSHVRDHMQPGWPSHTQTNGKSIFFGMNSSPFVSSSSIRAAQFIKTSIRIAWRAGGRRTSLRQVQSSKVNSGISSTFGVEEVDPLKQSATVTRVLKSFVRASVVLVELKQPGASSLVTSCSVGRRGMEAHTR